MEVREIEYQSSEYQHELELRNRLLRIPLGLDVYSEDLSIERDQLHYGIFERDELAGCVVVVPLDDRLAKIRQMAITDNRQGTGCGQRLLSDVESALRERGIQEVKLHARLEAVGFYEKLGYHTVGDEFVEVGIPHQAMRKVL